MTTIRPTAPGAAAVSSFDVCVIGAGAAGLVLTENLSRDGRLRVVLLEAGPDRFQDRREPFHVRSTRRQHAGVNDARVTAFGGATNTWGGGLMRLSPADFEPLDGRPDTAWPMPFDSLVPHYEAVESLFGFAAAAEGPQNVVLDRPDVRVRRREIPVLLFREKNFAHRFGPMLRSRPNVTILCNADIAAFNPGPGGQITSIDVNIRGGPPARVAAKSCVVAAGVVNTNLLAERILKAVGAGGRAGEQGSFFHDHLSVPLAVVRPRSSGAFSRRFGYRFERGLMLGEHFDIESKGVRLPGAFLHLSFDMSQSSILRPVRTILNGIQQRSIKLREILSPRELLPMLVGLPRLGIMRYLHHRLYLDPGARIIATLDSEQFPIREWKLESEQTGCAVTWDITPEDSALVARYVPICREILAKLQSEAAFELEWLAPDPATDPAGFHAYLKEKAIDALHGAGGLRMSAEADALVDSQLRLTPAPNVYVLGCAVFPRVGTSNPTHTILALGHRLAQHLLSEASSSPAAHSSER